MGASHSCYWKSVPHQRSAVFGNELRLAREAASHGLAKTFPSRVRKRRSHPQRATLASHTISGKPCLCMDNARALRQLVLVRTRSDNSWRLLGGTACCRCQCTFSRWSVLTRESNARHRRGQQSGQSLQASGTAADIVIFAGCDVTLRAQRKARRSSCRNGASLQPRSAMCSQVGVSRDQDNAANSTSRRWLCW